MAIHVIDHEGKFAGVGHSILCHGVCLVNSECAVGIAGGVEEEAQVMQAYIPQTCLLPHSHADAADGRIVIDVFKLRAVAVPFLQ